MLSRKYELRENRKRMFGREEIRNESRVANRLKVKSDLRPRDLETLVVLGEGAFGQVVQVRYLCENPSAVFALKVVEKKRLKGEALRLAVNERSVHTQLNHPFLVKLVRSFQCEKRVYFLLEYVPGGDLHNRLQSAGRFSEEVALFYACEAVLALSFLHSSGFVFRDLKPENVLIDAQGHIKLADFGFAKSLDEGRTFTLCGTAAYMAPEMLLRYKSEGYSKSVDWWAFGVLLLEMLSGSNPFEDKDPMAVYENIVQMRFALPKYLSSAVKNLILSLLTRAEKRLGVSDDGESIMQHEFFNGVCFEEVLKKNIEAPWIPELKNITDASNFKDAFGCGSLCSKGLLKTEDQDAVFQDF